MGKYDSLVNELVLCPQCKGYGKVRHLRYDVDTICETCSGHRVVRKVTTIAITSIKLEGNDDGAS